MEKTKSNSSLFVTEGELETLQSHLIVLSDLEKSIEKTINRNYYGSVAWLDPLVWLFLLCATSLNAVGLLFYKHNYLYLSVVVVPIFSFFLVLRYIRYLRKKNTLKMLSKTAFFPEKIKTVIKNHVLNNLQNYEKLIKFELEQEMISKKTRFKILKIFDPDAWKQNKLARQNCLYLGYLMINLQIKIIQAKKQKSLNN